MNQNISFVFEANNEQISYLPNFKSKMRGEVSKQLVAAFHSNSTIQIWSFETRKQSDQNTTFEMKPLKFFEYPDLNFECVDCIAIDEKRQELVFAFTNYDDEEDKEGEEEDNDNNEEDNEDDGMYINCLMLQCKKSNGAFIVTVSLENGNIQSKHTFSDEIRDIMLQNNESELLVCSGSNAMIQIRDWSHNAETHGQILKKLEYNVDMESYCTILFDKVNDWFFVFCGNSHECLVDSKTHEELIRIEQVVELRVPSHRIKNSVFKGVYLFIANDETGNLAIWKINAKEMTYAQDTSINSFELSKFLYSETLNAIVHVRRNTIEVWGIQIVLNEPKEEKFFTTLQREIPISPSSTHQIQFLGEDDLRVPLVCRDHIAIVDLVTGKITKEQISDEFGGIESLNFTKNKSHLL